MKPPAAAAITPKPMVSSSPGRPEKLPAPGLGRLLRGRSSGRSRARSAANPMFVSRSKSVRRSSSSSAAIDPDGGDPSSPKVTCIGQVRIRNRNRNKNKSNSKNSSRSAPYRCQYLFRTQKCYSPCSFFFCWRKQKKEADKAAEAEAEAAAPPIPFVREFKLESGSEEELDYQNAEDEETRVFVPSSTPLPPKNALLLMRCRSAPHNRSSALAVSCFPTTPVPAASETKETRERAEENMVEEETAGRESRSPPPTQMPTGLMRCKSEPAKRAERLIEVSYCCKWNGSGKKWGLTPSPPAAAPILLH